MKNMSKVRFISIGGLLTAIAVVFQSAPVFFPAIGLLLSPLSTLPIAIAAFYDVSLGAAVFFSSAFILVFVSLEEAIILLFTTGFLGMVIGTLLFRKGILISILISAILLSLGMISLTYVVGMSTFRELTSSISFPLVLFIYTLFSLIYASIWNIYIKKLMKHLI